MTISFHFRDVHLSEVILLLSFISLLIGSILIKKKNRFKSPRILILGSSLTLTWQIINFFIPGIYLSSPTIEDIEFLSIYGLIFTGIIPGTILLLSISILPLIFTYKNKEIESIRYLAIGALIFIISVFIGVDLSNFIVNLFVLIIIASALVFFAIFGYKIKNWCIIIFSVLYFMSKVLFILYL